MIFGPFAASADCAQKNAAMVTITNAREIRPNMIAKLVVNLKVLLEVGNVDVAQNFYTTCVRTIFLLY